MARIGGIGATNAGFFADCTISRPSRYLISGVTRDSGGSVLGNCVVEVFESATYLLRGATISDATGNYAIEIVGDRSLTFFAVAYKAGSPDLAGTTINTLLAS